MTSMPYTIGRDRNGNEFVKLANTKITARLAGDDQRLILLTDKYDEEVFVACNGWQQDWNDPSFFYEQVEVPKHAGSSKPLTSIVQRDKGLLIFSDVDRRHNNNGHLEVLEKAEPGLFQIMSNLGLNIPQLRYAELEENTRDDSLESLLLKPR